VANREKGEITITSDGQIYTLVFNTGAMAALEDHYSTPEREVTFDEAIAKVLRGSVRGIVALIWAMLQTHHAGVTINKAAAIIDGAGGLTGFGHIVENALREMQPDKADLAAMGAKDPGPQTAGRKARGGRSTAMRVVPA
jgi:hypothetical protein